jgi:transcriptional regulator with XRE-family HTH domain
MLTSDQIRAARALVRWSARELAEKADLSLPTIQRLEAAEGVPSTSVQTLMSIKAALEKVGVEFTDGEAPGVRLRKRKARGSA